MGVHPSLSPTRLSHLTFLLFCRIVPNLSKYFQLHFLTIMEVEVSYFQCCEVRKPLSSPFSTAQGGIAGSLRCGFGDDLNVQLWTHLKAMISSKLVISDPPTPLPRPRWHNRIDKTLAKQAKLRQLGRLGRGGQSVLKQLHQAFGDHNIYIQWQTLYNFLSLHIQRQI